MRKKERYHTVKAWARTERMLAFALLTALIILVLIGTYKLQPVRTVEYRSDEINASTTLPLVPQLRLPVLDTALYDAKMESIVHIISDATTSPRRFSSSTRSTSTKRLWPVDAAYPNYGALLPQHRIVAFYGNFYSTKMGILGENDATTTKRKLAAEVAKWEAADPSTPVIPAIDYIAITAQLAPGFDGKYRARMPGTEIQKAIDMAREIHGVVFLDLQVGLSDFKSELPLLKEYLKQPDVHLSIDPEFSMQTSGKRPGTVIGTEDAAMINWCAEYLAGIVRENHLPPKVLVVHRFTKDMVTHYKRITPLPEVQIVIDMDGWGEPKKKFGTYDRVITKEPVQFAGFKLFYKNDLFAPSTHMLTPKELLELTPQPMYIQYQ